MLHHTIIPWSPERMRRLIFSLIRSSGKAANVPKPASVGITSSQIRIAFGVAWSRKFPRAAEQRDELAPLYPNHVIPRACAVWVRLKRTLAALAHFARCLGRLLAVGARHERATVRDLRPVGAGRRQPAVDAAASSWPAVAVGFVRKLDARRARPLHAGEGLSPADAERLLAALPSTFEEWAGKRVQTPATAYLADGEGHHADTPVPNAANARRDRDPEPAR